MAPPSVSVALCTHNGAAYIEEQLQSILTQTLLPSEVVVSDDASTDDTLERLDTAWRAWATDATTLRVLRNDVPLGVTKNFEQALRACTGEFIALCDQDDRWHERRVERVVTHFEASPSLLLVHADAALTDETGTSLGLTLSESLELSAAERAELTGGRGFDALLRRNLVTGATTMIRAQLLTLAAPFPEPWVHDEWLAVIASATAQLDYLPEVIIEYRQHGNNQIGVRKLGIRGKIARLVEPRNDRNQYLLARAQVLLDRLEVLGTEVPRGIVDIARFKVAHQTARAALPARRLSRIGRVMREAATGRYSRFSRGVADIVRDLVQPAT